MQVPIVERDHIIMHYVAYSSTDNYSKLLTHWQYIIMPRPHRAEALSDDARLTSNDVCLSVEYIGPTCKSRTERPIGILKLAQRYIASPRHT